MRSWTPLTLAFYATFVLGSNNINIPDGQATLLVNAGQATTITWDDPSSGTVTIKLQQAPNITPDSGYVLASGIDASSLTATFTIPATANSHLYTIEIVDDTNTSNYNFSPNFGVSGATGTQSGLIAGITQSSASGAAASTLATSNLITGSSSVTGSASSDSASATSASSASSASASSASASSGSASSSMASASSSEMSSSASSSATTAPTGANAGVVHSAPVGLLAALMGAAALL